MKRALSALAALALIAACGDSGSSNNGGGGSNSTTFTGVISTDDGSASGAVAFTIATTTLAPPSATGPSLVAANATGSVKFNGQAAVSLSGTYDSDTDVLALTGGGYTIGGLFDGVDRLEGAFSGPNNTSGSFVTTKTANATSFCGTYTANDQSDHGTFSFVISGSNVRGEARSVDGTVIPLDGVIEGNAITIYVPGTQTTLATGTRSGNNASGTYGGDSPGTWTGGVCQ
jgi:hypothetical protein